MEPLNLRAGHVLSAIQERRSVRAYTERVVERSELDKILTAAARAASGMNTQPWRVHIVMLKAKAKLTEAIMQERSDGAPEPEPEYQYYPEQWPQSHLERCRAVGWALYGLLGIEKGDRVASRAWHDRNYDFFGAPIGMILTLDRALALGSLIDLGMFLEALMVAAEGLGLATCPQAAFASYHAAIRTVLALPSSEMIMCGLALGYEDRSAAPNALRTSREPLDRFVVFHDA